MKLLKPFIFATLFIAIIFTGCSKEKRVERTLFKSGGDWNITSATWEKKAFIDTGWVTINGTGTNIGGFSFEKDKEGFCEYIIDGESYSANLKWSAINETVYISSNNSIWDLFDDEVLIFEGNDPDKKGWTIEGTHTQSDWNTGYDVTITATFTLKKD